MAKQTIITCDVTGKEGAETISLPLPTVKSKDGFVCFTADLCSDAQKNLIFHLLDSIPPYERLRVIKRFFSEYATPELAARMAERLREL